MNNYRNDFFEPFKKPIARFLIAILIFLDVPLVIAPTAAHAADVDPSKWVNVLTTPDPMLDNLTIPADADTKGMWSPTYPWPMVAVHAAVLPNGKVLSYGTNASGGFVGQTFDVWDPKLGFGANSHSITQSTGVRDSFCSTATFLPNGNLLISGGNGIAGGFTPEGVLGANTSSNIYSPITNTISPITSNLSLDRWYATMITLPNGNPLMMGGMKSFNEGMSGNPELAISQGVVSMTPEIYENNQWRSLLGAYSRVAFGPDNNRTSYPRAWVAPNGLVFGVSATKMWYLDPAGDGSVREAGTFKTPPSNTTPVNVGATNTAAMYDVGKILFVGGNGITWSDGQIASNMATVVDINGVSPVLIEQPRMTHPRRMANAVVLATGDVAVVGGSKNGNASGPNAVYAAEIWNPITGTWTLGADASVFRAYHSQASLLPNGTIISYGGGWEAIEPGLLAQIYYPPYLFKKNNNVTQLATRPVIKAISGLKYAANDPIQLDMSNSNNVAQMVLIGVSNGTHAFNNGQRRIPLTFTQDSIRLTATIPNYNLTPPGYYQVVTVDQNGVPSLGTIIGIGQGITTPTTPTTPYTPPDLNQGLSAPIINQNGTASYTVNPASGTTYSWNFGDGSPDTAYSANPTTNKTYTQAGLYVVTLSAKNSNNIITRRTFLQAVATSKTANQATYSTPILYSNRSGSANVWVVNPDNDSVSVINTTTKAVIATVNVGKSPRTIAAAPDGRIWVTNKASATISIINPTNYTVAQTINLPRASQPHGLAFSPTQNNAFVVLEATGDLLKLDATTGVQQSSVVVGAHARHVSVNANTSLVLVSRFITPPLPNESSLNVDTSTTGGEVLAINPNDMTITKTVTLKHSDKPDTQIQGSGIPNYLSAAVISPDGTNAWVPSKQDNIKRGFARNGLELNFQNTVRAISSKIDLLTLNENYEKRVDHDNSSLGSAAVYHPSGVYLFVALETSRQVAVVDAIGGFEVFKFDVGRAPQGLTISPDGNTLYVQDFMDRSVTIVDLQPLVVKGELKVTTSGLVYTVNLNQEKLSPSVLLGKQLFYDAKDTRLSRDSYMSCASCHNDGGSDGRVWDLTGFGEGLRNTISLKGRAGMSHGFLHWSANFDEVQDFEKQIRDLAGGLGLMTDAQYNTGTRNQALGDKKAGISTDLDLLATYVSSLNSFDETPFNNQNGTLTNTALAGKQVFESKNCISCHASPNLTNSLDGASLRNIGTIKPASGKRLNGTLSGIDVPTLKDVWQTAPYLHDGSAKSIEDALNAHDGIAIDSTEMQNLVRFILEIKTDTISQAPNVLPTVNLTAPITNTAFTLGNAITLSATAADSDGTVARVDFYDGLTLVGSDATAPYSVTLNNAALGAHSYTAVAVDNSGAQATSAAVSITVNSATPNPTTALLSQNKVATQSSTRSVLGVTALPRFAVDGSTNGAFLSQSLSHTNSEPQPWWQVDLGQSATLSEVKIYNRTDCCAARLANFYVFSSASDMTGRTIDALIADTSVTKQLVPSFNGANNITLNFANAQARFVRVQLVGTNSLEMAEVQVFGAFNNTGANVLPTVSLTSPAANAVFTLGNAITLSATAADSDGTVARVDFYDGLTLVGSDATAPYSVTLNNAALGAHSYTAVAVDNSGAQATSAAVSVTVNAATNVLPTVSLTSPAANAVFTLGNAITLSATAADSDGTVARVDFYDGLTLVGSDATAPYSVTLNNAALGAHSYTAVAVDNSGAQATSAAVSITVNSATPNPTTALLSQNKVATQSSTRSVLGVTALPRFAVDGSTNGAFLSQSLSHTNSEPQPWWQVDLGQSATLSEVKIYNRTDCCAARLANFYVFSSASDMTGRTIDALIADTSVTKQLVPSFNGANNITLNFANAQARFVRVQLVGTNSLEMAEVQVFGAFNNTGANVLPTVSLTSPAANAVFTLGNAITLSATAADSDGTVARVDFYDGLTLVGSDATAPYSVTLNNAALGAHSYTAVAVDNSGAQATSAAVSVTVNAATNVLPTVSLTSPAANAVFTLGNAITLSATAADSDGTVARVDFYDGLTLVGSDATAPYSVTLNNAALGAHSYTAVAVDNSGAQATSAAVSITVNSATPNPTTALLSQNKVATQSSTRSVLGVTALPRFAVDGSTNGAFLSQSLSHTNSEPQPWWQVDLGQSATLSEVKIYNRTDCCAARLANFYVFSSASDMTGRTIDALIADTSVTKQLVPSFNGANNITLNFANAQARFVRVQLVGTNSLEMAEVQVFGAFNN